MREAGRPDGRSPRGAGLLRRDRRAADRQACAWLAPQAAKSLRTSDLFLMVLAVAGQPIAGVVAFNDQQSASGGAPVSLGRYLTSSRFAVDVAENWQFLAVAAMAVFSIYLRQRGSPESKPVGEPHEATGGEG